MTWQRHGNYMLINDNIKPVEACMQNTVASKRMAPRIGGHGLLAKGDAMAMENDGWAAFVCVGSPAGCGGRSKLEEMLRCSTISLRVHVRVNQLN